MKKKIFYVLMIACIGMTAIINTSCSNETDLVANGQQEKAGPKGVLISFGLSAEDYGIDNEAATRGVSDAQTGRVIATSTSNLGNGLEVLTEVVEDNTPKTRAGSPTVLKQDCHILAYKKDGEKKAEKKAEWYGHSDGRNFINKSKNPKVQYLEPGTYKFYVFNDYMQIQNDGTFTTNIGKGSRNAFYVEEEITIPNEKEYKLDFVLKPMFARVRTKLKVYVEGGLDGQFKGTSIYKDRTPYKKIINPETGTTKDSLAKGEGRFNYDSFDNSIMTVTEGGIKSYSIITPELSGNYFLDGTDLSYVYFEIPAGTKAKIFGIPAAGTKMPTKLKKDVTLKAGKSYTLVYTMYKLGHYLFSDGTVTSLAEGKSAGKTPVGFVVDEKKRIAIALNNAGDIKQWATSKTQIATTLWTQNAESLRDGIKEYNGVDAERGGYKETWDPSKTLNQKVRADNEIYPAFNAIKDLTPVNGKKWYVPGVGDWALALKLFGIDDPAAGYTAGKQEKNPWSKATTQGLGYKYQKIVFNQADGTPLNSWYWTANQWKASNYNAITLTTDSVGAFFGGAKLDSKTYVRPFISY